jgi:hypothetical protein
VSGGHLQLLTVLTDWASASRQARAFLRQVLYRLHTEKEKIMKTTSRIALIAAIVFQAGFAGAVHAQGSATPQVEHRQAHQQDRIRHGVATGQLTPREAAQLHGGQARVERLKQHAKADGVVTPRERRQIAHAQNAQSRKIYRKKHNARHM